MGGGLESRCVGRVCGADGAVHGTIRTGIVIPFQPAHLTVTYREYYTRCCTNTVLPPHDEHRIARNI